MTVQIFFFNCEKYFESFMLHFYDILLLYHIVVAYEDLEPSM